MDNNFEEDGDEIVGDEIIDDAMEIDEEEFFEPAHIIFMNDAGFSNDAESPQMSSSETSVDEIAMVNFAPEQQKALNEFSFEKHSKELLTKTNNKDLLAFLNAHWRLFTPICFNAMDTPTKNLIETRSNQILLKPLEVYICNSLDSDKALDKLNEFDDPPQLCGKVFKAGEPSYFCRDCGSDPTCVLCSNCFRRSKHRKHRYKMMTSGGGGYCDCGDPEAWKQYPCCELHTPTTRAPTDPDSPESYQVFIDKLPKDLIQRATELFQILIEYVFEILGAASSEELPSHLKPEIQSDDYVTMLYNDEVHSYDQVTSTLRKVLVIDDKKAFEYAAIVDKEGRSAIKRGKKIECDTVKDKVEHAMSGPISNALETKVMHHSLVAHQYFAEKIIVWLQKICEMSKGLKHILCKISLNTTSNNQSVIENLMLSDSRFWKSARSIMHQFFISVFFMDPYWKKEFAVLYTKNYKLIWRNHVKNPDDTVSLTDLAVQLFTVGSLAKYLIANYNLLATIMETLIEHCKTNKGKLSFPRTRQRMNPEFRRAQFILLDLKYSLTTIPTEWTESLRKNFIAGFKSFVEFMKFMHGMDGLKRLTQQHIEYEPEWETSFNLLIKLQKSIASLIDWCASDPSVFKECFRYLIHAIVELESTDEQFKYKYDKVKFNSNSYEIIDYSVMRQEVSIHAPLTRLLSAMFAQQRDDMRVPIEAKLLGLIEPSLRALCLVYQTNNGFWKRNGFSLLSQVYFYSNIKCRFEMFDRDVLCLQMGLAQMDSNEFLIDILHRFGLYQFLIDENFELSTLENQTDDMKSEYLLPMSEDFFELLIILVSERYESFISQIDPIKKMEREVIHQLCISSLAHSDLVKNIYPDNEKYTNDLESVLNRIATFKNSTSTKGVYELKEEYRSYYSPYFYHFSRTDKTKSEEYQMSLRKNEREKFFSPPRLPPLTKLFANMSHLLDCDVFIKIIFTVLRRFHAKSKLANEGQLLRVLYLIGLALHEEQDEVDKKFSSETTSQSDFKFLEKSVLLINQSSSSSSSGSKKSSLLSLAKSLTKGSKDEAALTLTKVLTDVNNLVSANNNPQAKLLVEWVMEYSHRLLKLKHKIDEEKHLAGENVVVAESSATTAAAAATDESSSLKEKRKNQIAEKSRAKVMAKLNKMQKNFMENYKDLYEETKSLGNVVDTSPTATSSKLTAEFHTGDENKVVCIGPDQNQPPKSEKKRFVCILCQEEDQLSFTSSPMVLCCYVQSSKVLSKNRMETIDDFDNFDPLYMKNTLAWGINTTSCGHVMHAVCWQKHVETVRIAENRRHVRYMGYNIKRNEYLCPLCETIGNTVLPLFPNLAELTNLAKEQPKETKESEEKALSETKRKHIELSYDDWLDGLEKTLENSIKKELHDDKDVFIINPCPLSTITKLLATSVASNFRTLFEFDFDYSMTSMLSPSVLSLSPSSQSQSQSQSQQQSQQPAASTSMVCSLVASATESNSDIKLHAETVTTMENFARISYTYGFATFPNDDDYRMPISVWTNCAYTIQVIEQLLSFESKPLFGRFSVKQVELLSSIVKQAALYGMTKNTESVRKNCVRLLALILPYNKTALIDEAKSIIEIDMFHLLVSLCLSMPNLYEETPKLSLVSNGGLNDFNVFKLVLQAHCVQVFLAKLKYSSFCSEDESKSVCEEFDVREHDVDSVYEFFRYLFGLTVEKNILKFTDEEKVKITTKIKKIDVYVSLVKGLMPFLRCSALFFSNLTGLAPIAQISGNIDQFYELLAYLGVTKGLDSILETKTNGFKILCNSWLSLIGQSCQAKSEKAIKIDYPIPVNHFIDLPNDFVDLISMSMPPHQCSSRTSSLVDTSAESATILCLICGEMLCSQQFCCPKEIFKKRVGCCTAHAYECSGSVGVFLRVAECQVLLMQLNMNSQEDMQVRGCFVPAPYLDDYGETDQGLRRGNPLHLCKVRYNKLYKDWLSHAIPEEISRSYQNQTNNININWVDF